MVQDMPFDEPARLAEAAHVLKNLFIAGTISTAVAEAIARAYAELGRGRVVVNAI